MKMTIEEAITQLYSIDEDAESHLVGNKIDDKAEMKFFPEDFFKAYSEVQLDVEIEKQESEDDGTA